MTIFITIVVIILGLIYLGLLFELIIGWNSRQNRKFYKKLFDPKIYYITMFVSILLLIKPIVDLIQQRQFTFPVLAIPFVYLLLFKIINRLSLIINKRNIIIVGRGDYWPKEHKWYVDSVMHFFATILSISIPIIISAYYDGKLN